MNKTGILEKSTDYWNTLRQSRFAIPALLLVTLLISFFLNLGSVPLFDRDEGAFSEATREMFERDDFISTYLNGEPRYDKPILIYWFQALSIMLFGVNEWGFRFPSAVFAALWVLAVYAFTRREYDRETALKAAIIMSTSLWVIVIGRAAIADALLNLFITLSMLMFYNFYKYKEQRFLYYTFLWTALGFLTKGPVALVIPVAVSFLYFLSLRSWKTWFRLIMNPYGILIFLVTSLPWYVVQYLKEGQPFIEGFFLKHNVGRYVSTMEGHGGTYFYYIPMLLVILLPYTSLIIRTAFRIRNIFRDDLDRFLWYWFFFVLIFFSLSGTQLPHYVLHGAPPLFILMARYSGTLTSRFWALLPVLLFFLMIVFLPELIRLAWDSVKDVYFKAMIDAAWHVFDWKYRLMSAGALLATMLMVFLKRYPAQRLLISSGYLFTILVVFLLWPVVGMVQQQPVKNAAEFADQHNLEMVMWMDNPSFSVYREKITPWRKPVNGEIALTKINKLKKLQEFEILYKEGGLVIVKVIQTGD